MSWINEEVISQVSKIRKKYSENKPIPHVVIQNFLKDDKFKVVKSALEKEPLEEKCCDLFHFFQSVNLPHAKMKVLQEFTKEISSVQALGFLSMVTGTNLSGSVDVSAFKYIPTNYLLCHDDQLEGRKIAFVYYTSEVKGGELVFYNTKKNRPTIPAKKVSPAPNCLVIFEVSPRSFHEVAEVIQGERYSVGGWFY